MKTPKLIFLLLLATVVMTVSTGFFVKSSGMLPDKSSFTAKLKVFGEIVATIQRHYIEKKDYTELIDKAIDGVVKELDPHSAYLRPRATEIMNDNFQGYAGIGVSFTVRNDKITIMEVFKNGPSDIAMLERGDRIIAIEGKDVIGIEQNEVPKLLKGPAGTSVKVTVERPDWDKPRDVTINRGKVVPHSVNGYFMLNDITGYLKIDGFIITTAREVENALILLEGQGMKQLILDLRGNTGGYLQAAFRVTDFFLKEGKKIVFTKDGEGNVLREYYSSSHIHPDFPLIVMIDRQSASASEILSGAIQDWDRGLILGRTSFGKGLVQTPFKFGDGSSMLLTTARYYTPSGRLIQRDYKGKSVEDYYREGHIDSIKAKIDNKDLIFKTASGRVVYGGGGINPDFELKGNTPDTLTTTFGRKMRTDRFDFFTFSDKYIARHRNDWKSIPEFKVNFNFTEELLEDLYKFAQENDYKYTKKELRSGSSDIVAIMKYEIGRQLWGWEGFYKVRGDHDEQLDTAVTYFNKAKEIMALNQVKR